MEHFIASDLYAREGKALTNFSRTLPDVTGDLAQELTKDPYSFAFTGLTGKYNERVLKDALLGNITKFLIELGTGFAYVGKEYRLEIGDTENFIDLLFYNLNLSCYVVVEVKIGKLAFADLPLTLRQVQVQAKVHLQKMSYLQWHWNRAKHH